MNNVTIIDHVTGRSAKGIDYRAIEDAVRGWREPLGFEHFTLDGVEIIAA